MFSFTLDLVINPIVLAVAGIIGIVIGYLLTKAQVAKVQRKIKDLESDLLNANQETLEAQRAYVSLESQMQQGDAIPVIPMKINGTTKESPKEKATK